MKLQNIKKVVKWRHMNHVERFYIEKNSIAFLETKGYKKIYNFLIDLIKKDHFSTFLKAIRIKYDIPEGGFKFIGYPCPCVPEEWIYEQNAKKNKETKDEIKSFCKKYRLSTKDWVPVFENYIFYNKISIAISHNAYNLCYAVDILKQKNYQGIVLSEDDINAYPVGLLISPYASERDIIDYISKIYTMEIKPLQDKYKASDLSFVIGKSKTKDDNIKKRKDLIYKNKDLPIKKISKLIGDLGLGVIDHGHIGAIKSQECKSKKEV